MRILSDHEVLRPGDVWRFCDPQPGLSTWRQWTPETPDNIGHTVGSIRRRIPAHLGQIEWARPKEGERHEQV